MDNVYYIYYRNILKTREIIKRKGENSMKEEILKGLQEERIKSEAKSDGLSDKINEKLENEQKVQKSNNDNNSNYNNDYDNVFKSMKYNNKELFIPIINDTFGKNYTKADTITILPSEGDITKIISGKADIESRTSDFLMKIRDEFYLIEEQSYRDGTMAIRIAEYAFIAARQNAVWKDGRVYLKMPNYCVIYIKSSESTSEYTKITYEFPNGQFVDYDSKNVIVKNYTKEDILEKRLYAYIPYYILRYEKSIKAGKIKLDVVEAEMLYLLKGLKVALDKEYIDEREFNNIKAFTNTIIEHFVKGKEKERLVNIMGGKIIYTEADKIYYKALKDGLEEGIEQGSMFQLFKLVDKKLLSLDIAINESGLSKEEFMLKKKNYEYNMKNN